MCYGRMIGRGEFLAKVRSDLNRESGRLAVVRMLRETSRITRSAKSMGLSPSAASRAAAAETFDRLLTEPRRRPGPGRLPPLLMIYVPSFELGRLLYQLGNQMYKFLFDLTDGGSWPLKVMRRWVAPPQRPGEIFRARAGARQGRFAWGSFRSTTCPDGAWPR